MPKYYFGIVVTVVYSSTSHLITTDIGDKAIAVSEAYLPRVYVHIIFEMTFFFFYLFSEYPHYELLGPQHLSLQRQISCCLITPPPEAPAQVHDWNDTAVSGFLENYDKKKECITISGIHDDSIQNDICLTAAVLVSGHPGRLLGTLPPS